MRPRIKQGTSRVIRARNILDANGDPLVVTGWSVHAVACRNTTGGTVLSEWSTSPTGTQGTATAIGSEVALQITPGMSASWNCNRVVVQAKLRSPANQAERIINQTYDIDREATSL